MTELETKLRTTLAQVADSTSVPDWSRARARAAIANSPRSAQAGVPRRHRHRRALTAIAAAMCVVAAGLGASAAVGKSPKTLLDIVMWRTSPVSGAYNAIPSSGRWLMTTRGPFGRPMQVWYSAASHNGYCISYIERTPDAPHGLDLVGGDCSGPVGGSWWHKFGGAGGSSGRAFNRHVPGAATVRLVWGSGQSAPLPLVDGWTAGTLTRTQDAEDPQIVGYNRQGHVIGRVALRP